MKKFLILALAAALMIFPSCQNKSKKSQVLNLSFNTDPATLDARKNADVCTSNLQFIIREGLTRLLPKGEVEFALAKSVDISDDGMTYIFHLRNASWSDGEPITAHDFEYSWKKILTPSFGSPCPYLLYCIENAEEAAQGQVDPSQVGVHALDDLTLKVQLKNPTPYFLSLITFCNFYPIPKHVEMKNPSWHLATDESAVCNGPFQLVKWVRNKEIILKKNPSYWDAANVRLDGIHVNIVHDEKTLIRMFENGDLDVLNSFTSPFPIDDLVSFKKKGKVLTVPVGATLFCTFNLKHPFLSHPLIRKAFSLALDRKSIIENITQMSENPAWRYVSPAIEGYPQDPLVSEDAALAKSHFIEALKELKITPEEFVKQVALSYESIELHRRIAQAVQHQWKTVLGIEVLLKESDFKTELARLQERSYSIGLNYWVVQYTDPVSIFERFKYIHSKKNYPGYENPAYVALLDQASATNNPSERMRLLEKAEALIISDMPLTPIFHFNQTVLKNKNFSSVQFSPLGTLQYKRICPSNPDERHEF